MTGNVHMKITLDPIDVATIGAVIRSRSHDPIEKIARSVADYIESLDLQVTVALPVEPVVVPPVGFDKWFKLPMALRERFWKETEYATKPPSEELTAEMERAYAEIGK